MISGFGAGDTLLVSIGFVNPPSGTTFSLPVTSGLTAGTGYNFTGGKTQISFTGSMNNANAALAAMTVATGATDGTITIRVSASVNRANLYYNPINGHYYEYVSGTNTYAWSANPANNAFDLADARTLYGVRGYLATITSAQEQKFVLSNIAGNNIWIGGTDYFEHLNTVLGAGTFANQAAAEGQWHWVSGPEAGTRFWVGNTGQTQLWVDKSTNQTLTREAGNAASARYENWCTGNPSPDYTLTAGRGMGEPNDAGTEHYLLEKWGGAACWNDWGRKESGLQGGYLVEYSENWGTGANARGSFQSTDVASAEVSALVDNAPRNVSGTRSGNGAVDVSWAAPLAGTVTGYTVTSSPGSRQCTATPPTTTCVVTGLTSGTSYTFSVTAAFSGSSDKTSLPSAAVIADNGRAPVASVSTASIKSSEPAQVSSDEVGTAYLVKSTVSVSDVASITGAPGSQWNQVTISAVNTPVALSASGLVEGTYKAYAVDPVGLLSSASSGTVTVDDTAPTVTLTAVSSTGSTTSTSFRVTGDEAIDCSTLSRTEDVDFSWTGISSIESIAQTSSTICTVTAQTSATAGGATVVATLDRSSSFAVADIAGNTQTALSGAPKSVSVSVPATTTATIAPRSPGAETDSNNNQAPPSTALPDGSFVVGPTTTTTTVLTRVTSTTAPLTPISLPPATTAAPTSTVSPPTSVAVVATPMPAGVGPEDAPSAPDAQPGQIGVQVGGRDTSATVRRRDDSLEITVLSSRIVLQGVKGDGNKAPLDSDGSIDVDTARQVRTTVTGFLENSDVEVWVMSTPTPLGTAKVSANGDLAALYKLPGHMDPGQHRLVVNGINNVGEKVVIAVGVRVVAEENPASWSNVFPFIIALAGAAAIFLPAVLRRRRLEADR